MVVQTDHQTASDWLHCSILKAKIVLLSYNSVCFHYTNTVTYTCASYKHVHVCVEKSQKATSHQRDLIEVNRTKYFTKCTCTYYMYE